MGEAKRKAAALPSLMAYLQEIGSQNADERDGFAAFADMAERFFEAHKVDPENAREASFMRTLKLAFMTTVEGCNAEIARGAHPVDAAFIMSRSMGAAIGYALMSSDWKEGTPHRSFGRVMGEEFVNGVKFAVDATLDAWEKGASAPS
ncbi:MAG: hypothetical protein QM651_02250 [Rhodoblastus sp.]